MSSREDLIKDAKSVLDGRLEIAEVDSVPHIDDSDLTFGLTGKTFFASVLYLDLRGSSKLLLKHKKPTVVKIHKALFKIVVDVIKSNGGVIRSFNGDSILAFFHGNYKHTINNCVRTAMKLCYILGCSEPNFVGIIKEKYDSELDFGIGLHHGEVLAAKIGRQGESNRDLVWVGEAVNFAAKVGDQAQLPCRVEISTYVYDNLFDNNKFIDENKFTNIWEDGTIQYAGSTWVTKCTRYHLPFE